MLPDIPKLPGTLEPHGAGGNAAARARILDAADALLHRLGPAKMGVADVARVLGMSHANVDRHFPGKAALRDAMVERWLHGVSVPLTVIAEGDMPPPGRLAMDADPRQAAQGAG